MIASRFSASSVSAPILLVLKDGSYKGLSICDVCNETLDYWEAHVANVEQDTAAWPLNHTDQLQYDYSSFGPQSLLIR